METRIGRAERRREALTQERIVATAVEILDAGGENALTFRALAKRLATGSGAIYWHVGDRGELLAAAVDLVVDRAMAAVDAYGEPRKTIRAIAVALFDVVDAHPWAGAELNREPWRPGMLRFLEGVGGSLLALGVPERARFDAWSALVNYVFGVAGQNAANARRLSGVKDRTAYLDEVAESWERLDPEAHPFLSKLAARLREHDDREQFLAGIDLILAGIDTGS